MTDLIPPSGRVHWIGTGMSSGSGLGLVCDGTATVLWGRTVRKAQDHLARLGLVGAADTAAYDPSALARALSPGDVVVSMLPAVEHPGVLRLALEHGSHFVCSSYVSPGILEQAETARERGAVVLTEIGLDPGIDHLLAHELVRRASTEFGTRAATARFTSSCGSNPAEPNDFRYRFAWAPRGVLTALLTPAQLIDGGVTQVVARPWEAVTTQVVGDEVFEVYPNRDSVPFVGLYAFPDAWRLDRFVRGTLRLEGWRQAWKPVFAQLQNADDGQITELAAQLAQAYPTSASDHDRIVMSVRLELEATGSEETWSGEYLLDVVGDARESATARLVSVPLACGILDVVGGAVTPGVHQATSSPDAVGRWLAFLRGQGITAEFRGGTRDTEASVARG